MEEYDLVEPRERVLADYERSLQMWPPDDCDDYYCEQPPKRWSGKRKKKARKQ